MSHRAPSTLRAAAAGVCIIAALLSAGCSTSADDVAVATAAATPAATETTPDASASEPLLAPDAFAERDAFLAAQQQPRDGSPLVAVTDAQRQFISEQRAFVESQGGAWTADLESIALAAAIDACETSILNAHVVDLDTFRVHVDSSPLFAAVTGGDPEAEAGMASVMVFGTAFLCPDDAPQWEAAYREAYAG